MFERGRLHECDHLVDPSLKFVFIDGKAGCAAECVRRACRPREGLSAEFGKKGLHGLALDAGYAGNALPDGFQIENAVLYVLRESTLKVL